jgi:hypothetical protein
MCARRAALDWGRHGLGYWRVGPAEGKWCGCWQLVWRVGSGQVGGTGPLGKRKRIWIFGFILFQWRRKGI